MSEAKPTQVKSEAKPTQVKPVVEVWQAIAECHRCYGYEWFQSGTKTLCLACNTNKLPNNCKVIITYLND